MVRTFVKDNKGGYLGICAGAYLACGGGGFGLDLVDGCTPWRHSLWPRGGRLYGTIEVTDEVDESHPSYECNFSNGALFETQELPPSAVPIGIVRQGTGSAIQKAGLEGKAVVVAARASSCSGPEKCGKVVLCGCHVERDTCALKRVNGVLQQFVELVVENSKQRPKDRSPVALCECTKCIPLSDAARKEIAAAELARKRRIRAYVQAAEVRIDVHVVVFRCDACVCLAGAVGSVLATYVVFLLIHRVSSTLAFSSTLVFFFSFSFRKSGLKNCLREKYPDSQAQTSAHSYLRRNVLTG